MTISYSSDVYNLEDILHYHIAKYRNSNYDKDELYQIAYLGYLQAKANYNPDKGRMTLLYVSKYIKGALYHTVVKNNKIKATELDFLESESGDIIGIDESILCDRERTEDLKFKNKMFNHINKIKQVIHLIPEEEASIIYDYYLSAKPKSLLEIARLKGVTKQRIHQIKAAGIEKIKVLLGKEYLEKGL